MEGYVYLNKGFYVKILLNAELGSVLSFLKRNLAILESQLAFHIF